MHGDEGVWREQRWRIARRFIHKYEIPRREGDKDEDKSKQAPLSLTQDYYNPPNV
jgi:hypothetical protein